MNRSPWGRPQNGFIQDLQALAFWIVVIGLLGYLLFPNFFSDLVSRLKLSEETTTQTTQTDTTTQTPTLDFPTVFQEVYGSDKVAELSQGYWAIFIKEGQFEQLALSEEAYRFLVGVIEKDRAGGNQKVILAANGQVRQILVSEEVYSVVSQLAVIGGRSRAP